jgi:hypothetical protein
VGGAGLDFGLDAEGEFDKDGAGPLADFLPNSFRINFHMIHLFIPLGHPLLARLPTLTAQ